MNDELRLWFRYYHTMGVYPYFNTDWQEVGFRLSRWVRDRLMDEYYPNNGPGIEYVEMTPEVARKRTRAWRWYWRIRHFTSWLARNLDYPIEHRP